MWWALLQCLSQRPAELVTPRGSHLPPDTPAHLLTAPPPSLSNLRVLLLPPVPHPHPSLPHPLSFSPGRIPIWNLQRHPPRLPPLGKVTNWTDWCHSGSPETPPGVPKLVTALAVGGGGCSHTPAALHTRLLHPTLPAQHLQARHLFSCSCDVPCRSQLCHCVLGPLMGKRGGELGGFFLFI